MIYSVARCSRMLSSSSCLNDTFSPTISIITPPAGMTLLKGLREVQDDFSEPPAARTVNQDTCFARKALRARILCANWAVLHNPMENRVDGKSKEFPDC